MAELQSRGRTPSPEQIQIMADAAQVMLNNTAGTANAIELNSALRDIEGVISALGTRDGEVFGWPPSKIELVAAGMGAIARLTLYCGRFSKTSEI